MADARCGRTHTGEPVAARSRRANAGSIASVVVSIWRDIDAALAPIIGNRGVAALFHRTLHLIRHDHAWLTAAHPGMTDPVDYETLHSIGLAVARDLVEAHGGAIIARSRNENMGSEFIVTLPTGHHAGYVR